MSSRAVSPDSSTQPKQEHRKVKKRKQKHRSHKNKKKKKDEKTSGIVPIEAESNDLAGAKNKNKNKKKLPQSLAGADGEFPKPLAAYQNDREELFKQLMSMTSKKDLKDMLPDILKKESLKEVKRLCLEQLRALSTERLQKIISGQPICPSSDEESFHADSQQTSINTAAAPATQGQDPQAPPITDDENDAEIFEELITAPNQEEIDELVEGSPDKAQLKEGVRDPHQGKTPKGASNDDGSGTANENATPKDELELKELEFRARALKSLVQARERQMKLAVNPLLVQPDEPALQ